MEQTASYNITHHQPFDENSFPPPTHSFHWQQYQNQPLHHHWSQLQIPMMQDRGNDGNLPQMVIEDGIAIETPAVSQQAAFMRADDNHYRQDARPAFHSDGGRGELGGYRTCGDTMIPTCVETAVDHIPAADVHPSAPNNNRVGRSPRQRSGRNGINRTPRQDVKTIRRDCPSWKIKNYVTILEMHKKEIENYTEKNTALECEIRHLMKEVDQFKKMFANIAHSCTRRHI